MKTTLHVIVDDTTGNVQFHASTDNGKKLSRLESAYMLSKILPSLIKDGAAESGNRLIVAASSPAPFQIGS